MNCIIASYLTTGIDIQRDIYTEKDNVKYIEEWYDTLISNKLNGIIFYDDLSDNFIKEFPKVKFNKVDSIPEGMQLHDYRWFIYLSYLKNNTEVENIFFTDIADVKIIKDPFIQPEFNDNTLYIGDETCKMDSWIVRCVSEAFELIDDYHAIIGKYREENLLNCGIVGGNRNIIISYLELFKEYTLKILSRPILDKTVDVPIFNYVVWKYFYPNIVHGLPVNSRFCNYENIDNVWFIHK